MKFEVYGKDGCAKCKSTKDKLTHLVGKAEAAETVALDFYDMETVEGLAEGAFNDVRDVPTVILRGDDGEALARWEGVLPPAGEVQVFLASSRARSAAG